MALFYYLEPNSNTNMLKDGLNSVLDNLKERTTNPFLGTLIVVWIIHNWKLVYSLFYFDAKLNLEKRLAYIDEYFIKTPFYLNLLTVFGLTVLVLCVTYVFLGLSRFITDFYEKIVIPKIVQFNDKSAIVLKADFLLQKEIIKQLEERLEAERIERINAQSERDRVEAKLLSAPPTEDDSPINKRISKYFHESTESANEVSEILHSIQSRVSLSPENKIIKKLLAEDLVSIEHQDPRNRDNKVYNFTQDGKKFLRYWNNLNEDNN